MSWRLLTPSLPWCSVPPAERRRLVVRAAGPTAECDCPPAPQPKLTHWQQTLEELGKLRDMGCQVSATAHVVYVIMMIERALSTIKFDHF
jgi:hypothetical protein